MRTTLLILILIVALPTSAQQNCGNGLPCGPIPWSLPQFPDLRSPTPFIWQQANQVALTSTPVPTATSIGSSFLTPTPFSTFEDFSDNVATLQAQFEATDIPITNELGTPIALDETIAENGSIFFSYARGFTANSFGVFAPLIDFIIFAFLLTLVYAVLQFTLPVLTAIFGAFRRLIQFLLDFIPG